MHQRVWHHSEEEERRAVKRFLTGQPLTGGRKMAGEPPRKWRDGAGGGGRCSTPRQTNTLIIVISSCAMSPTMFPSSQADDNHIYDVAFGRWKFKVVLRTFYLII